MLTCKKIEKSSAKRVKTFFLHDCKHLQAELLKGRGIFTTVILSRNYRRKSSIPAVVGCHFDDPRKDSIHCDICTGGVITSLIECINYEF